MDVMNGLSALTSSGKRRTRWLWGLERTCGGPRVDGVLSFAIQVTESRCGESANVVLDERAGRAWESLREAFYELGVEEDVSATEGHVVEAFGEVHFGLTLLDMGRSHDISLVSEQVVRDKSAGQRLKDERPGDRKAIGVMGSPVEDVSVRRLSGSGEEEFECTEGESLTDAFIVEGLCNGGEETECFHGVLSEEGLQGGVEEVHLALQLLERKVFI